MLGQRQQGAPSLSDSWLPPAKKESVGYKAVTSFGVAIKLSDRWRRFPSKSTESKADIGHDRSHIWEAKVEGVRRTAEEG